MFSHRTDSDSPVLELNLIVQIRTVLVKYSSEIILTALLSNLFCQFYHITNSISFNYGLSRVKSKTTKNTERQEKFIIKWQNQTLKHIKRMGNNCHIPEVFEGRHNCAKGRKKFSELDRNVLNYFIAD